MLHEALVEAPMLDPAFLASDVAVLDVDLRGLREARQLLVGRLGRDDARCVGIETRQPHGETPGIERMKLHEAGPGLVEQDVVAEMADTLEDHLGTVNGAVIGALLDDGDAERARLAPGFRVLHQRMVADALAQGGFVERVPAHRADQPPGVAHRRNIDRNAAGDHQRAMMGGLVIVAVEQHEVAVGDERAERYLVGGRGAVEHEVGLFRTEDLGGFLSAPSAPGLHGSGGRRGRARNCRGRRGTPLRPDVRRTPGRSGCGCKTRRHCGPGRSTTGCLPRHSRPARRRTGSSGSRHIASDG